MKKEKFNSSKYPKGPRKSQNLTAFDISSYCRNIGIALIGLGIIHFIFKSVFDALWGVPLISVGIFAIIFRKRSTLILFGISLCLVGLLNLINTLLSDFDLDFKWLLIAVLQIYWGILEFIKFKKIKGIVIEKKKNRVLEIIAYIVLSIIFLIYLFLFMTNENYSLYKDVNGKQEIINYKDCKGPYYEIGIMCCIPDEYGIMCQEESKEYAEKLEDFINENKSLTKAGLISNNNFGFSFISPENYTMIEDNYIGGIPVPYILTASGVDSNQNFTGDYITILIKVYKTNLTDFNWQESDFESLGENQKLTKIKTKQGYDAAILESLWFDNESDAYYYLKEAYMLDSKFVMSFESNDKFKYYAYEFDDMVDSFQILV